MVSDMRALASEAMAGGASDERQPAVAALVAFDGDATRVVRALLVDWRCPLAAQLGTGNRFDGGSAWIGGHGGLVRLLTKDGEIEFEQGGERHGFFPRVWAAYVEARDALLSGPTRLPDSETVGGDGQELRVTTRARATRRWRRR